MKNTPHPIQYQGSKRNLASTIFQYLPKDIDCLIEPFAGSAAISIAAAERQLAKNYWINDLNKPLSDLLQIIVESPADIVEFYKKVWNEQHDDDSLEHYYKIREDFNQKKDPRLFLYLLSRCVKGSVRYNSEGLFNQSPDKRRHGTRPETMRANILGVSALLKGKARFSANDYKIVLAQAQQNDFIYMDPPYQGVCGDRDCRYLSGINHYEFITALQELNSRSIRYVVSYDGRRGDKTFGQTLPDFLNLTCIELNAGRSSQATLLGRDEVTYESLYLSPSLIKNPSRKPMESYRYSHIKQLNLLESCAQYV